jgi:rhodanese-related sulfurtransferase
MELYLAIAALALALLALLRSGGARRKTAELEQRFEEWRRGSDVREADDQDLGTSLEGLRKLVALMAAGRSVDAEMVKENRLYRNARPADVQKELENGAALCVIDVRTPQEWGGGHIPDALHIPVDDIQKRLSEVPRDGRKLYLICAGGGRSSAAANFLANRGFLNVHSVEGGMGAWRGKVVRD